MAAPVTHDQEHHTYVFVVKYVSYYCYILYGMLNALKVSNLRGPKDGLCDCILRHEHMRYTGIPTRVSVSLKTRGFSTNKPQQRACCVYQFTGGLVPYHQAWKWQQRLLHERMGWQRENPSHEGHDVLLVLEHPSVYTLGRGSTLANLLFDPDDRGCEHEVRRTERGGEVTWHGPGQLVGYPVLDLNYHRKDLHWYLRQLEEVIIRVLSMYSLEGERDQANTGVWVGGDKVAAIGLNASRWVTSHGFSLNVAPDMEAFERIIPCGIEKRGVACLDDLVEGEVTAPKVRQHIVETFANVFQLDVTVKEVLAGEGIDESALFPSACDEALEARLNADLKRQLELYRPGRK
ncbi:unnamed protein product [Discosporangium mesarthrocarpum]